MGYADGGDLSQKIQSVKKAGKQLSEEEVLDLFVQICLAIQHVHDKRILHRDLKTQASCWHAVCCCPDCSFVLDGLPRVLVHC